MKKVGMLFIAAVMFSGCLEEETNMNLENSQYNGTFMRLEYGKEPSESPVTLTFANGTYSGQADSLYYPAICNGTYSIEGNKITFDNECFWTANFDWSLILQGTYSIEETNGETVLIQELSDGLFNVYQLTN